MTECDVAGCTTTAMNEQVSECEVHWYVLNVNCMPIEDVENSCNCCPLIDEV